jgi:hypothetical protein
VARIGFDSLERYAGEKFEVAWEDFEGEWIRAYSKQIATNGERGTRGKKVKKGKSSGWKGVPKGQAAQCNRGKVVFRQHQKQTRGHQL